MGRRIIHISIFPPTVIYILEKKNHQIQGNNNLKKVVENQHTTKC
jgi:hypothetical protein